MPAEVGASPFYVDTRGLVPYARRIPNTRHLPFASERIWLPWVACPGPRKMGKVPIQLNGRTGGHANPAVLVTALDAAAWAHRHPNARIWVASRQAREVHPVAGLLLNVLPGSPYAGIDLDDCRDAGSGVIQPWAAAIVDATKDFLYWEVSPGLQGLRGIGYGAWNIQRQTLRRPDGGAIELYDGSHGARALTFTGLHLPGTEPYPRADAAPERLAALAASILPPGSEATTVYPVEIGPVPAFQALELDDLHLDDHARRLITEGTPEGADRSATLHFLAVNLLRLGNAPEAVACLLADERYPISRAAWDRRGTRTGALTWVWKYIVTPARNEESGLTAAFEGLEEVAGEGLEKEEADEEDSLYRPEPTWRDLELARKRQAVQNLYESPMRRGEHFSSIKMALTDSSVLALLAGMAAGKTREVQETVIEYLERDDPEELLIVATPSFALMSEITREVLARLGDNCRKTERLKIVASNETLTAFVNPRTDDRPYRVIICSHASLLPRGDDIASVGRVLRKLQAAVDHLNRNAGRPLRVWAMIDEVDAYLHRLVVILQLGLMELDTSHPAEGEERKRPAVRCPATCHTCFPVQDYSTHSRGARAGNIPVLKIAPSWPVLPGATEVKVGWLKEALLPPSYFNGVEVSFIDPSRLPTETEKPLYDVVPNKRGGGLKTLPLAEGIVRELAAQPGATVRRGLPRDRATGSYLNPREIQEGSDVLHPYSSCAPRLVSFNPRPLAELRAATDRLTLMTATLSRTGEAMIATALGPSKTAIVVTPPERKLKRLLVIGVTRWAMERAVHAELVSIAPTLLFHAQKKDAEEHADEIASWRDGIILPATWGRRGAEADIRGRANLVSAYTRAAIGLGYNLPFFRITIIWSNCYVGTQSIFALGYDDLFSAIEGERQNIVLQNGGRTLRWDTEDPLDNGYRVIVVVIAGDPKTNLPAESLDWAVNGWKGNVEHIDLLMLNAFPRRTVQAAREWLTTGETSVNDLPAGPVSGLSSRQRLATAELRAAEKEARKAENRIRKKEEKKAEAAAMAEAGQSWRETLRTTHIDRYFDDVEELERFRKTHFGDKAT